MIKKQYKKFTDKYEYLKKYYPNIIVFIYYGMLFDIVINMYKPFLTKLLYRLGGDDFIISLYNSLPGLAAAIILLPGSIFISRFANKKRITSIFIFISRFILLILALIPFLPSEIRPLLFVIMVALMNFPDSLSQTSVQGIVGQAFDSRVRAHAISLRSKIGYVVVMIVTLLTGCIISFSPEDAHIKILCYQMFFVFAFLVGMAEIFVFNRFKLNETSKTSTFTKKDFKRFFTDKHFMKYFATTMIFTFFWQSAWPLIAVLQIEYLGANEIWLAFFAVLSGISSFFLVGFWNKLINKHNNFYALSIAMALMAINLLMFPLAPNLWFLAIASIFGGFATSGITVSLFNGLLASASDKERIVIFIGIYNTFTNLSLFISPFFAFLLLKTMGIHATLYFLTAMRGVSALVFFIFYKKDIKQKEFA